MSQKPQRPIALGLLVLCCAAVTVPNPSAALEGVVFRVAAQDDEVEAALRGASVLLALDTAAADDVFAAALAEYGRLVGALYARGHYAPVVSVRLDGREASGIAPLDAPQSIGRVEVSVDPGPLFRFGQTRIAPLAPGTALPPEFRQGSPAESGLVKEAAQAGVDGWRDLGHAKATVAGQDVVADHRDARLDVGLTLAPGPRLRFGAVAVEGQQRTRENRVRKIAGLPQGEVYSPAEVERAADRLRRTGTFRSVSITEDEAITAPDLLGTTISVVEEKPRNLSFGAEISSLDGLDLTAAWMHRNLFGGAEKLRIEAEVAQIGAPDSGIDYRLGLTLDRPATLTPDTTLRFATEIAREEESTYVADRFELSIGFSHVFSDTLTGRIDIGYEVANGSVFRSPGVKLFDFDHQSLTLPIGVTWDRRDSKTDATRGFYIDAEVKPFLGFGTTGSGVRGTADLRGYRAFGADKRFVLAARAQIGAILGPPLLDTPQDDRFLSGGGGTVRGQPYQSLGVRLPAGGGGTYLTGGNRFLALSVEARGKVTEKIGVVGFVDAGRVDLDGFFTPAGDWHAGAGLGLRYDTGIGPIRVDLAAPVGGTTGRGAQIYIGIGQSF